MVSTLISNQQWNEALVQSLFPLHIAQEILAMPLPNENRKPDVRIGPFIKSGVYFVDSGDKYMHHKKGIDIQTDIQLKYIWKSNIP